MTRQETLFGWVYLGLQLLVIPTLLQVINLYLPTPMSDAALNFLYFSVNLAAVLWIFRRFLKKSLDAAMGRMGWMLQSAFLGFAVYQLATYAIGRLIGTLYPGFANVNDGNIASMTQQSYTMMAMGTIFFVPIAEETLYRGLVFQGLYNRNKAAAYTVSTLVFCAIHVVGYVGVYEPVLLLLCFVQYIPAGLCLAWAYARADTILAPILIHMTVNAMGIYTLR